MPRMIDAEALLKDIGEEPMKWADSPEEIQEYIDWKRTVAIINSAPTIDAIPVKKFCEWLALLKEQEARLLTLEEVKAFDWDYCYLEEERLPGKEYRTVCGDYALTCITWPCVASLRIQYGDNSYGKKWRCWSAKPTDEQRRAVKWDE